MKKSGGGERVRLLTGEPVEAGWSPESMWPGPDQGVIVEMRSVDPETVFNILNT